VNGYPLYRRRNNGNKITLKPANGSEFTVDNRHVIPYNKYLCRRFNAHINVEICSTIKAVKYLFKYIYKGHSSIIVSINLEHESIIDYDEIRGFMNARYVGPCEAFHRIYSYNLHGCSHSIFRLAIHLEDMQSVYFIQGQEEQALAAEAVRYTSLTGWFELNKRDLNARKYLYHEIPEHYTWHKDRRTWAKRKTFFNVIGRLYNISPRAGERFYLRLLLLHRPGCVSFRDIRTIDRIEYNTYKEAAQALHLLRDDSIWDRTIAEAVLYEMPYELRQLFAIICIFCEPTNVLELWEKYFHNFIEDYLHRGDTEDVAVQRTLCDINNLLSAHGKNNSDFNLGLPLPNMAIIIMSSQRSYNEEVFDSAVEMENALRNIETLNPEQLYIFKCIMHALYPDENQWVIENNIPADCHLFFVDAAAGTGKTFV
jgi:hypothetical protein